MQACLSQQDHDCLNKRDIATRSLVRIDETAPYFHDGSQRSLMGVINFYDRGFVSSRSETRRLDIDMRPLGLTTKEKFALLTFLMTIPHITR